MKRTQLEIYKNKYSGKHFIYIEDTPEGEFLLVTPAVEIKPLEPKLFEEYEEKIVNDLLSRQLINKRQFERYNKFIEQDSLAIWTREIEAEEDICEAVKTAQKEMSARQWDYIVEYLAMVIKKHTGDERDEN